MKITHISSGLPYQLNPGTQLEVERTNLFFNEYGEQTVPVELPDTDQNRQLTGFSDLLSNTQKPSTSIKVSIQDGEYYMACRQAILSSQRKKAICTSFYMNEGSFLLRIADTSLSDVFGDETIPGITTVQQGIDFCRSLVKGENPDYAIFPILIDSEESYENGYPKYKFINRFGYTDSEGVFRDCVNGKYTSDFYNVVPRSEIINGKPISLSSGFYMSPFMRANYLLKRIFQYFGYTLNENFFTRTYPFPDLVFVNNCADSLVNGTIRLVDLLPDCMCSTILEVFRKKFCCEFFPNEVKHTVDVVLYNEAAGATPTVDLSKYLTSMPKIDIPEAYQQLILDSEERVSDVDSVEDVDSIADLFNKYQAVELDNLHGHLFRRGYQDTVPFVGDHHATIIKEKVANSSMRYYAGGNLKTKEITVPDKLPEFRKIYSGDWMLNRTAETEILYIGEADYLNSRIVSSIVSSDDQTEESTSKNSSMKPMLAFFISNAGYPCGTICNYIMKGTVGSNVLVETRISEYTLCYNGDDGIFERFYRTFDDVYRNSLYEVSASFLLPDAVKQSLPAHLPVLLCGQKLFIDKFSYLLGGKPEPIETKLLTCRLYEPLSSAKKFIDYFPIIDRDPKYYYTWEFKYSWEIITKEQYENSIYKDLEFNVIFPPYASEKYCIPGKKHFLQYKATDKIKNYYLSSCWLECMKYDWADWPWI